MNQVEILNAIIKERKRQDYLHPKNNTYAMNLAILIEEVGEVGKALQGEGDLTEELIHVAAFTVRWLENA